MSNLQSLLLQVKLIFWASHRMKTSKLSCCLGWWITWGYLGKKNWWTWKVGQKTSHVIHHPPQKKLKRPKTFHEHTNIWNPPDQNPVPQNFILRLWKQRCLHFGGHQKHVRPWKLLFVEVLMSCQLVTQLDRWLSLSGGFLKWWYPTTIGFPTKNDHFGGVLGVPLFLETPKWHQHVSWLVLWCRCFFCLAIFC